MKYISLATRQGFSRKSGCVRTVPIQLLLAFVLASRPSVVALCAVYCNTVPLDSERSQTLHLAHGRGSSADAPGHDARHGSPAPTSSPAASLGLRHERVDCAQCCAARIISAPRAQRARQLHGGLASMALPFLTGVVVPPDAPVIRQSSQLLISAPAPPPSVQRI